MDTLVIDFETKKAFDEVGGKENIDKLGISVAGVYSYAENSFRAYEESELVEFEKKLSQTEHLIGFNILGFDLPVLKPYLNEVLIDRIAVTDIFDDALKFLGHRISLAGLAKTTLGASKSGHGLEALKWFKEGRIEEVKKYCLDDVRLTRDLYEYGKKHGHVLFESHFDRKIHSIPVRWGRAPEQPIAKIVEDAFLQRKRLKIEYVSSEDAGKEFNKERLIDVYKINKAELEAYCHLRKSLRNFRISRIVKAEPTRESYVIPQDVQDSLF